MLKRTTQLAALAAILVGCGGSGGGSSSSGGGGGVVWGGNDTVTINVTSGPNAGTIGPGGTSFQFTLASNGGLSGPNFYSGPVVAGAGNNSGTMSSAGNVNITITANASGYSMSEQDTGNLSNVGGGSYQGTLSGSGHDNRGNQWTVTHQLNIGPNNSSNLARG